MRPTESSPQSALYFPADWDIRRWGKAYVKPAVAHVPVKRICTGSFLIMKTSPSRLPKYFYRTKIEISVLFLTPSFWSQPHPWFPSVHTSRRYQNLAYTFLLPEGKKKTGEFQKIEQFPLGMFQLNWLFPGIIINIMSNNKNVLNINLLQNTVHGSGENKNFPSKK